MNNALMTVGPVHRKGIDMANGYEVRIGEPTKSANGKRLMPFVMIFREEQKQESIHDLKPCPFCGSNKCNVIEQTYYNLSPTYGAKCWNCKAESWLFFDTKEEAIEAWNRRVKRE